MYRKQYFSQLCRSFPKIPYPKDQTFFWRIVKIGETLRKAHLLIQIGNTTTTFHGVGSNTITKGIKPSSLQHGKLWINETQYFDGIPQSAWDLQIGSYVVARKWLNDRKRHKIVLQRHDIEEYVKIIAALQTTHIEIEALSEVGWS